MTKIQDGTGSDRLAGVDKSNQLLTHPSSTSTFELDLAMGKIEGMSFVHKFGNAEDYDQTDGFVTIHGGADDGTDWEQMVYLYSTTADIDSISSNSAGDTQTLEIQGLDANWELVTQYKALNGLTRVALDTPMIRVFRLRNINTTNNAGHVFCFVNTPDTTPADGVPDDATKIRALIHPGKNQTLMAVYTIPQDKTGYLTDFYVSTHGASKDANYDSNLLVRFFGGVFQIKHTSSTNDTGTSHWIHHYTIPLPIQPKTDIEIQTNVLGTAVTAASLSAGFDIILVDN